MPEFPIEDSIEQVMLKSDHRNGKETEIMNHQNKVLRYITDPDFRFIVNAVRGLYDRLPDEAYLQRMFRARMGYELNLNNPQTFNEKLQWLKLYDRKPIYTTMVDKYEAKKYVAGIIGEQYIIPTLGVWDKFDDIDFDSLPDKFVLKSTHDSGGVVICRNRDFFNIEEARVKINQSLQRNYYYQFREWPYKDVKPRIIAEEYFEDPSTMVPGHEPVLNDYKLQCFDGKFDNIFVAEGRFSKRGVRYHYFDRDWNYIPYCPYDDIDLAALQMLRPKNYEKMIEIAEKLSAGLPELRVDLYEINGRVYFGEMTFYSQSGFDTDITPEADRILGGKLALPDPNA